MSDIGRDPVGRSRQSQMRMLARLALMTVALFLVSAVPAEAAANGTVVTRGFTHTEYFPDDICGPRASTVTFTETIGQSQFILRADGTYVYREVAVVTYWADYVDPTLPDFSGRLVEVNHFIVTPGVNTDLVANTFHDFGGGLKIFERLNFKVVDGDVVVDREIIKVTGCP